VRAGIRYSLLTVVPLFFANQVLGLSVFGRSGHLVERGLDFWTNCNGGSAPDVLP
jgi:hypothetical protein